MSKTEAYEGDLYILYSSKIGEKNDDLLKPEATSFSKDFCSFFSQNKSVSFPKGI